MLGGLSCSRQHRSSLRMRCPDSKRLRPQEIIGANALPQIPARRSGRPLPTPRGGQRPAECRWWQPPLHQRSRSHNDQLKKPVGRSTLNGEAVHHRHVSILRTAYSVSGSARWPRNAPRPAPQRVRTDRPRHRRSIRRTSSCSARPCPDCCCPKDRGSRR